jgi:hypothetical protein
MMTALLKRSARRIAPMLLAATFILSPAAVPTARAQEDPAATGPGSKGDPVPWYLGAGLLAMVILFCVGKSARR